MTRAVSSQHLARRPGLRTAGAGDHLDRGIARHRHVQGDARGVAAPRRRARRAFPARPAAWRGSGLRGAQPQSDRRVHAVEPAHALGAQVAAGVVGQARHRGRQSPPRRTRPGRPSGRSARSATGRRRRPRTPNCAGTPLRAGCRGCPPPRRTTARPRRHRRTATAPTAHSTRAPDAAPPRRAGGPRAHAGSTSLASSSASSSGLPSRSASASATARAGSTLSRRRPPRNSPGSR